LRVRLGQSGAAPGGGADRPASGLPVTAVGCHSACWPGRVGSAAEGRRESCRSAGRPAADDRVAPRRRPRLL